MDFKSFGPVDEGSAEQLRRCIGVSGDGARGVLCADHHLGYGMPIGGVVASRSHIMPAGVGYDIGCGNLAVRTEVQASSINVSAVMDEIATKISFGVGRANDEPVDDPVFDEIIYCGIPFVRSLIDLARNQLGTVGSGNHYVDLFEDRADGRLWIGVHFGSRGFGHKIATHYLKAAGSTDDSMHSTPAAIPADSGLGSEYLEAMKIAGHYADAGRNAVVFKVLSILGNPEVDDIVHNHHNFAWGEIHAGQSLYVTRKGATPAFPGQRGFIGGSMGDDAVIVEGIDSPESREALFSTVHGAGRVMGRLEARGKWKNGVCVREPKVNWKTARDAVIGLGVELRGADADEAPECYKRLPEVLGHHAGTIRILHALRPIGVAMAKKDVVDPYKD